MTKLEYEKITELLKENKRNTEIINSFRNAHKHILVSKYSDDSDANRYILNDQEIEYILNNFLRKREEIQLQLKELGYYD